jgi:hypothetical protein
MFEDPGESAATFSTTAPFKRPRGRPPLSGKAKMKRMLAANSENPKNGSSFLTSEKDSPEGENGPECIVPPIPPADPNAPNPLKVRSISTSFQSQRLMALLLTNGPLVSTDIFRLIPGVSADQMQGILDVRILETCMQVVLLS